MDNITNKALIIAVGIFVTIAITSGILASINEMKDIYKQVYETDTSITSRFSEFDKYDGTIMNGIDLYNAVKKYNNGNYYSDFSVSVVGSDNVEVTLGELEDGEGKLKDEFISKIYNVTVEYNNNDSVRIKFN